MITDGDLHRASALVLQVGNDFENYVSGSGYAAHELARLAPRLVAEIERLRASEASWNKEAERHERDHRAHYEERERLRAEVKRQSTVIDTARALLPFLADGPDRDDDWQEAIDNFRAVLSYYDSKTDQTLHSNLKQESTTVP